MLETPHVVVGAAIAVKVGRPELAIPLALISHFILDHIPHWNPSFFTETKKFGHPARTSIYFSVAESFTALFLGVFIAYRMLPNFVLAITVIAASFASVASDVVKIPFFFWHSKNKWLSRWVDWERSIQVETDNVLWGVTTQIIVILASLYWIF